MTKIRELELNSVVTIALVVMNATARETKAKKPFLQLDLYDGVDMISGNYWDWAGKNIPAKNTILNVTAQVTEYLGVKQLNIKSLTTNTERHISEFMPSSDFDIAEIYKEAFARASGIKDDFFRRITLYILEDLMDLWYTVPGAVSMHHAYVGGTLIHSLSVAKIAQAISNQIPASNSELCFTAGLLHDVGKLFTYKMNGLAIEMTPDGSLYDHTFIGAEFIGNYAETFIKSEADKRKLQLLRHIVLAHHGSLEFGAPVLPMCVEAHIVHSADSVDSRVQPIIDQSKKFGNAMFTDRIWSLGNKPQLTTQYVREVLSGE